MVPLSVAQEAERRQVRWAHLVAARLPRCSTLKASAMYAVQREWLQQLTAQTDPGSARRAALENERRIREQQVRCRRIIGIRSNP